jgi:peptide/nickel transport system permease protein
MAGYIIRRLLIMPVTLIGLSLLIFGMLQLLGPAERAALYMSSPPKTEAALQSVIEKYGLNRPVYEQYADWVGKLLKGDLGWSKTGQQPVIEAIGNYFPATLELALWSFIPIITVGIWLGVKAAVNHDKPIDQATRLFSIISYAIPTFVFGLLMLMIFYATLKWFPPGRLSDWATQVVNSSSYHSITGMYTIDSLLNLRFDVFLDAVRHILLPALTIAYVNWALILRVMRSSMLDTLRAEYTTVARAKGLKERAVINRHARPNAMIPVVTIGGLFFAGLLNGAVISETVFNFHGVGWWATNAAINLDAISVLGVTLFSGMLLILANLVVDLLYAYLDPRIRLM